MQAFEYASPVTLHEAFALLGANWGDADLLAGGTDQISLMKEYVHTPKRVVSIRKIKELRGVRRSPHGVRIGANVTVDELMNDAFIRSEYPSLIAAARGIASPQIRNMGTVVGDLCQRPRCWYFRNGYGLLAMRDGKSLVPGGENKYHAIFGNGPAYFVSASSFGPPLIALGAQLTIASSSGSRTVAAEKFFIAPQDEKSREVDLKPNEIVTEIIVPAAHGAKNATYEVRQKEALDWPLAAASVSLTMDGGNVKAARIVLGHVAPTPWIASDAAQQLAGKSIDEQTAEQIGAAAVTGASPLSDNGYKVQLAKVAVKRALLAASGRA